jgi:hypothetical protein
MKDPSKIVAADLSTSERILLMVVRGLIDRDSASVQGLSFSDGLPSPSPCRGQKRHATVLFLAIISAGEHYMASAVIWSLILILYGGSTTVTHLGNFSSYENCLSAAKSAKTYNPDSIVTHPLFMCVEENDPNTTGPFPSRPGGNPPPAGEPPPH